MYKKLCDRCYQLSFSSTEIGEWICPSCNRDITKGKLYEATEAIIRPYTGFKTLTRDEMNKQSVSIDIRV